MEDGYRTLSYFISEVAELCRSVERLVMWYKLVKLFG